MSEPVSRVPQEPHTGPLPPAGARPEIPELSAGDLRGRAWPAVLFVALQAFAIAVPKRVDLFPGEVVFFGAVFSGPVCLLLLAVWWTGFSKTTWLQKLPVVVALFGGMGLFYLYADPSTKGMMVPQSTVLPGVLTAGVLAFWITSARSNWPRVATSTVALAGAWLVWGLLAIDGFDGTFTKMAARWRWSPSPAEVYAAGLADGFDAAETGAVISGDDWPRFRGPNVDSSVPGVTLAADWDATPPTLVWRRPVGPGWSSFAYVGGRLYTQEQRGEFEAVACWDAATGAEQWVHEDETLFTETIAGAGPRATPTVDGGKVFAVGANGAVNCLDAATGDVAWSRDLQEDTGVEPPTWGFSASPCVVGDVVVVLVGGPEPPSDATKEEANAPYDKAVIAYDRGTGEVAWTAAAGKKTYSSAEAVTLAGVEQVLVATGAGLVSLDAATGEELWRHDAPSGPYGSRIIQPAVLSESDLLVPPVDEPMARLTVTKADDGGFETSVVWESNKLKPNYNDFVVHDGHAYGFDKRIFTSIDLATGDRNWKGGRYGQGQVVLLPDGDQLLVVTEKTGELVLLAATPEGHEELTRCRVLEGDGTTWNHPTVVGRHVFVRNGEEAVCYELPLAETAVALRTGP
ncbi:MAG: PQQ-binding-like beta-propeller repeat protein [Planctomycetota bacterium]